MNTMKFTCSLCEFYCGGDATGTGSCTRYPPRAFPIPVKTLQGQTIGFTSQFPAVSERSVCGEFVSRKSEAEPHEWKPSGCIPAMKI
jgi:hypothetical protein